jgi:DHA2 family multidrug resistance protein
MAGAEVAAGVANADHMTDGKRILTFVLMAFGMFMALLDTQIIASSIAEIQSGLAATADEISLIQTSYLIAEVIMIPMSGWLSRMLSTRWLFTISAAGFTLASLLCATAQSIESMVIYRALQGFLGGAMIPTVFATGFVLFTGPKQAKIPAILGLTATLAPVLGPTIGGVITDYLSWRWIFFINIVPGLLITFMVPRLVKIDRPDLNLAKHFDFIGALFLALFLGCLQYVLDEGARRGWMEDNTLFLLAIVSGVSGVLFVTRSLTNHEPIVDLTAFKDRNFLIGCLLSFIVGIGLYGTTYLTPVFLGHLRGYSALQIGTTVFIVGVFQIMATPLTVILRDRLGVKVLLLIGFGVFGISCLAFGQIDATWGKEQLWLPQALRGFATMFCIVPVTAIALSTLSPEELKGASGLYNLMRNLGGAIGLALINTNLFYNRLTLHYNQLLEHLNIAGSHANAQLDALTQYLGARITDPDLAARAALKLVSNLTRREALVIGFTDVYFWMALVFFFGVLLIPLVKALPPMKLAPADH